MGGRANDWITMLSQPVHRFARPQLHIIIRHVLQDMFIQQSLYTTHKDSFHLARSAICIILTRCHCSDSVRCKFAWCTLWCINKQRAHGKDTWKFETPFYALDHIIIIIILTRPKPAYGLQGLAGLWGQDTDEVRTFLVFLMSHFAPAALSSDLNQPGTMKNKNWPDDPV